ncbi:hypothetical protein M409DRAFT_29234 [Zasmidium cellare ATCC 36951]|uniref:Uncharacterized protein n=1 Tax=Zasmidium cellare ATCC 36951 TaxID=1080233 RepID=A0A6A6C293_ZASCE|nr:uncharacterized protein M409DRAFT_29234 [Zasmidium cellare ATCC 36951]KAF2160388.1 hypothetical protein M409DRAFT_29234 [Zasmidium cellare ATCC 36951]
MRFTTTASVLAILGTTLALPVIPEKNVTETVSPSPEAPTYHVYKAAWKREAEAEAVPRKKYELWKRREFIDPKSFSFGDHAKREAEEESDEAGDPKTLILWRDAEADPKKYELWKKDAEAEKEKFELWKKEAGADAAADPKKYELWRKDAEAGVQAWKKDAEADAEKFKLWRKDADADADANKNKFELWKRDAKADADPVVTAWKREADADAKENKFELWKKEADADGNAEPTIAGAW